MLEWDSTFPTRVALLLHLIYLHQQRRLCLSPVFADDCHRLVVGSFCLNNIKWVPYVFVAATRCAHGVYIHSRLHYIKALSYTIRLQTIGSTLWLLYSSRNRLLYRRFALFKCASHPSSSWHHVVSLHAAHKNFSTMPYNPVLYYIKHFVSSAVNALRGLLLHYLSTSQVVVLYYIYTVYVYTYSLSCIGY